jgi:transposase InsO family protein
MLANHKREARIMREDNLLAVQPRQFVVTTKSDHELEVYLNLARRMKLTGIDQLWVADITYIRLRAEFVYLAVILDGFSRKVVGWALERTLTSRLAIAALQQAIEKRQPRPGLIHHSDRGVQYASGEYVAILDQHQMIPSMSRPANPYDNASCESFIKTLKREEIYANAYENLEHLRANVEIFIEQYDNQQRLHSALGYRSPEEFERQAQWPKCGRRFERSDDHLCRWLGSIFYKEGGGGLKRRPLLQTSSPLKKSARRHHERQMCQSRTVSTEGFKQRRTAPVPI